MSEPSSFSEVLVEEALRPGQAWSRRLRRNQILRLTDVEGNVLHDVLA